MPTALVPPKTMGYAYLLFPCELAGPSIDSIWEKVQSILPMLDKGTLSTYPSRCRKPHGTAFETANALSLDTMPEPTQS